MKKHGVLKTTIWIIGSLVLLSLCLVSFLKSEKAFAYSTIGIGYGIGYYPAGGIYMGGGLAYPAGGIYMGGRVAYPTGEIYGRVVNQAGQAIPGTAVRVNNIVIPTNRSGEFRFTQVHNGIYTVYYDAPGYVNQIQEYITVTGGVTVCPTVIMTPTTSRPLSSVEEIFGRVVSATTGQMIPGTAVRINNIVIPPNPAGEFRFAQVPPGVYTIYYDAPGYIGQIQEYISVYAGQATTPPTCILSPALSVTRDFYPSGWMGDGEEGTRYIKLNTESSENPHTPPTSVKVIYQPGPKRWAGIYWQYPENNWGSKPGRNLQGYTRVTFWARGERGGEVVEFKAGDIKDMSKPYQDTFAVSLGKVTLSTTWRKYEINLAGQNLSNVIGAFAWVATGNDNPQGLTFYLDDIYYE